MYMFFTNTSCCRCFKIHASLVFYIFYILWISSPSTKENTSRVDEGHRCWLLWIQRRRWWNDSSTGAGIREGRFVAMVTITMDTRQRQWNDSFTGAGTGEGRFVAMVTITRIQRRRRWNDSSSGAGIREGRFVAMVTITMDTETKTMEW